MAHRSLTLGLGVCAVLALGLTLWVMGSMPWSGGPSRSIDAQSPIDKAPVPPSPEEVLGDPTDLVASPAAQAGAVDLQWTPGANADFHLVYIFKSRAPRGAYWNGTANPDGSALIEDLDGGDAYWFIVIAGQAVDSNESYRYSEWSNWSRATPRTVDVRPVAPTPPDTDDDGPTSRSSESTTTAETSRRAEFEGRVLSVNRVDQTFTMRVYEAEHLGGLPRPSIITVERSNGRAIPSWVRVGRFVEAEGDYLSSTETLVATEIDLEDDDDDDDD